MALDGVTKIIIEVDPHKIKSRTLLLQLLDATPNEDLRDAAKKVEAARDEVFAKGDLVDQFTTAEDQEDVRQSRND